MKCLSVIAEWRFGTIFCGNKVRCAVWVYVGVGSKTPWRVKSNARRRRVGLSTRFGLDRMQNLGHPRSRSQENSVFGAENAVFNDFKELWTP